MAFLYVHYVMIYQLVTSLTYVSVPLDFRPRHLIGGDMLTSTTRQVIKWLNISRLNLSWKLQNWLSTTATHSLKPPKRLMSAIPL